jgi:hypothetical protein
LRTDSQKTGQSAAAAGLNDHVTVRQSRTHAHRAAFCTVFVPTVVMSTVRVPVNHNVASIMDDDLRRRRDRAQQHRPTILISASFVSPGQKRGSSKIVSCRRSGLALIHCESGTHRGTDDDQSSDQCPCCFAAPPGTAEPAFCAPMSSTGKSTATLPAFSKCRVALTCCPLSNGFLRPTNIT